MVDQKEEIVSLYQPTSRIGDSKDLLIFKNLIKEVEKLHLEKKSDTFYENTHETLQRYLTDSDFWKYRTEGMALFIKGNQSHSFDLNQTVKESVNINTIPFLLPLLEARQNVTEHFVLNLSKDRFQLWLSNGTNLLPVDENIAVPFADLFNDLDNNSEVNYGSYKGKMTTYHGHRSKAEEEEKNIEKYFRYLDDKLSDYFSQYGHMVLLGGTSENVAAWKQKAKAHYYLEEDLGKPVNDYTDQELMKFSHDLFQKKFEEDVSDKLESLNAALQNRRATTNRKEISEKISMGNVEHLFVGIYFCENYDNEINKIVYDALIAGSNVIVVPQKFEEQKRLVAAQFRY